MSVTRRNFDTHRCSGSLGSRCSIRRLSVGADPRHYRPRMEPDGRWYLYVQEEDWDWDYTYMNRVATIRFCPFCGMELG